jgi:signal transduction histidine kinase
MIMIIALLAIYYLSATSRRENFYDRLTNRVWSISRLLFETPGYDADRIRRIENNNPFRLRNEKIIVLDFNNEIIYSSDETGEIELRNDVIERVRLSEKVRYRQGPYEVLGVLYITDLQRFVVIAAATDTEGRTYLNKLRLIMIIACLVSLIMFFIAGWVYSERALKPISDVIEQVEDISITSLNLRVPEGNGTDEIGRLARTFNRMLERLEKSFSVQKDFIANASHELRTPLTSINGQLEVLVMKDRSSEEYKTALASVLDDIKSLIDLSNRLLLIARTSAEGPVNFHKRIRIDEILWQAKEEMIKFKKDYRVEISIDESLTETEQMMVTGDESLIKIAFTNIIDNACKYSKDKTVKITLISSDKWITTIFRDNGIGISKEEIKKVFEPFYRGSNAQTISGSGIGLPLVSQIINNHNGTIEIKSKIGQGTEVIIKLPLEG